MAIQTAPSSALPPPPVVWTRERIETLIGRILKVVFITFFVFITAFPFYWMLNLSIRPFGDVLTNPTRLFPTPDQLANFWDSYNAVLFQYSFTTYIVNSLVLSLFTVGLTLLMAIPGAYAVTRMHFRYKNLMSFGILLVYMFPAIVIGIPLFVIYSQLGIRGSLSGMIVIYMSGTLPVALYMLRSYFLTLPAELEEAALIDGCTTIGMIRRVVLPLSVPAVASVGLYTFMIAWNEILFAILFLTETPTSWTLPLGLRLLDGQEVPRTYLMAGSVIITIPVLLLFFSFERFLTRGLTAGAVKG